jgi:hypothetical protein
MATIWEGSQYLRASLQEEMEPPVGLARDSFEGGRGQMRRDVLADECSRAPAGNGWFVNDRLRDRNLAEVRCS